jgi:hypothetical protein
MLIRRLLSCLLARAAHLACRLSLSLALGETPQNYISQLGEQAIIQAKAPALEQCTSLEKGMRRALIIPSLPLIFQ